MLFSENKTVKIIVFGIAGLWSFHFSGWKFTIFPWNLGFSPPAKWWLEGTKSPFHFRSLGWFLLGAYFDVKLCNFFPSTKWRYDSDASLPPSFLPTSRRDFRIPRSGPSERSSAAEPCFWHLTKTVDPTGTAAGKKVCKPNSKRCLGRSTRPHAFSVAVTLWRIESRLVPACWLRPDLFMLEVAAMIGAVPGSQLV